jgi:hypothetical protein
MLELPLVMIGADSHKRTHTLVALDEVGRRLAEPCTSWRRRRHSGCGVLGAAVPHRSPTTSTPDKALVHVRSGGSQVTGQLGEQVFGARPDLSDARAVRAVGVAVPGDEVLQRELVDTR